MTSTKWRQRTSQEHLASLSTALAVHEGDRDLVRFEQPDTPYFHLSDTAWATCHRLDIREAEHLIKNRAAKGFTCIMVVLLVQHGAFLYPNREGYWPFEPLPGHKAVSGEYLPDVTKPTPAYWDFVDRVVGIASRYGITIAFLPTWGRYVTGGYYGDPILFDKENAFVYGKFLGQRYPFHPWIIGGDTNRYWNPDLKAALASGVDASQLKVIDFGPVFESMAQGVLEGERIAWEGFDEAVKTRAKGYKTFMTFHPAQPWLPSAPVPLASAEWPDADWLDLDTCQTGHHDGGRGLAPSEQDGGPSKGDMREVVNDFKGAKEKKFELVDDLAQNASISNKHAQAGAGKGLPMWFARSSYIPVRMMYETRRPDGRPRPVIDLEPHYENTRHWFDYSAPVWRGEDIRTGGWQAIFAGSCGYVYGCNSIIQMHNDESKTHLPIVPPTTAYTNWYLELDLEGANQVGLMRRIMLSLPNFFTRVPDQTFITSDTNEPTDPEQRAGDRLIGGMRGKGWAMVYLPYGGDVEIDLARALPGSLRWRAWWINPRLGGKESFDKGDEATVKRFVAPSGGSIKEDWILYVETGTREWLDEAAERA